MLIALRIDGDEDATRDLRHVDVYNHTPARSMSPLEGDRRCEVRCDACGLVREQSTPGSASAIPSKGSGEAICSVAQSSRASPVQQEGGCCLGQGEGSTEEFKKIRFLFPS